MGDRSIHDLLFDKLHTPKEDELERQRREEERDAKALAFHAEAYRHMPSDLRHQAETWGVGALMELVFMNAWENGYKQAVRDHADRDRVLPPAQKVEP